MENAINLPSYWTPKRRELLEWLNDRAPSLAELYQGAVQLLYEDPPLPGRSRFIAHAVREIRNRLPDVIAGVRSKPLQYKNRLDVIAKEWKRSNLPLDEAVPITTAMADSELSEGISVPPRVFRKIASLVRDHIETRERPEEAARRLFTALAPENEDFIDQLRPIVIRWRNVTEWFVSYAHDSGRIDKEIIDDKFIKNFEFFENMLGSLIREFFAIREEVDEVLEEANA